MRVRDNRVDPAAGGVRRPGGAVRAAWRRWPAALGLAAAAALLASGVDRATVAVVVCVATLCYLGAAALHRPWVAWAGILGGSLVVAASELLGVVWWVGVGAVGVALVAVGLLGGAPRPGLAAQVAALAGYGGVAVTALYLAPRAGLTVAGIALVGHAVWDAIHFRRDRVVPRSLAECCMVLDLLLGVGAVVLALAG